MYFSLSIITSKQADAFKQASGVGISYQDVQETLAVIFIVLLLLWWAWLILSQYRLFVADKESLATVGNNVLRSSLLIMFLFYVVYNIR